MVHVHLDDLIGNNYLRKNYSSHKYKYIGWLLCLYTDMIFSMHILLEQVLNMKDNYYIHFFILSVLFDILTGNLKNIVGKNKNLNSSVGIRGLIKHVIVLLLVLTIYPYLAALNFWTYANSIVVFYIFNYTVLVIENLNEMGIKLPKGIKKYLKKANVHKDN